MQQLSRPQTWNQITSWNHYFFPISSFLFWRPSSEIFDALAPDNPAKQWRHKDFKVIFDTSDVAYWRDSDDVTPSKT